VTGDERDALILSLAPQVKKLAFRKWNATPKRVGLDELTSAAWLGAIAAVDRFEVERGVNLATYADWKIRSAIADYLRSLDPLTRGHRRQVSAGECEPVIVMSLQDRVRALHAGSDDCTLAETLPDRRAALEQRRAEEHASLQAIYARAQLQPRSAKVLKRWVEGETLLEIGASIGVVESRASHICSAAIRKLRAAA
jgi:RNA polymerase sigma factor for flagellar operon FliA